MYYNLGYPEVTNGGKGKGSASDCTVQFYTGNSIDIGTRHASIDLPSPYIIPSQA